MKIRAFFGLIFDLDIETYFHEILFLFICCWF